MKIQAQDNQKRNETIINQTQPQIDDVATSIHNTTNIKQPKMRHTGDGSATSINQKQPKTQIKYGCGTTSHNNNNRISNPNTPQPKSNQNTTTTPPPHHHIIFRNNIYLVFNICRNHMMHNTTPPLWGGVEISSRLTTFNFIPP